MLYNIPMKQYLWDYDEDELKKTQQGRLKILERKINYGLGTHSKEKISLSEVKKNWTKLQLFERQKQLFELLIWGK